ncbi:glycosyl transferase [Hoeflea sp. IMCC20628]|uniref:sugar transferase n=1 Tax=Hoeflea sp. IMCC20628 TaxID=1620421 RepID=UPI00063BD527|nr:sugar transferase [Hoeflea sp. IMCC20628]AKI02650.1 glycosyl transferase [Hoeflea sp. IMCC20628]
MRIVITGGSGFVGQNLVPLLAKPGVQLLLVGRDPARLARLFPDIETCGYDNLEQRAKGWDLLVHLAVANTDAKLDRHEFMRVNVAFLIEIANKARRAGIERLVNISSTHALDETNHGAYAASKRQAVKQLAAMEGLKVSTIYLPVVYGDRWGGRLAKLNRLPNWLARALFSALAALKPTVHVSRLADRILSAQFPEPETELILADNQQANAWFTAIKRTIDLAAALSVLLFFWWALALIWVIIRLQSPGPGIFAQKRVGKDGRQFVCYKFRTMKLGTPQAGTHEVSAGAITSFGRYLRAKKIDELPQILNILRNEMSLIGPRPCLPTQTALIEARRLLGVLEVKPGISGLAQINGIDMSDPERLAKWDARYLALQSLRLDLAIGLSTIAGKGRGDKVAQ